MTVVRCLKLARTRMRILLIYSLYMLAMLAVRPSDCMILYFTLGKQTYASIKPQKVTLVVQEEKDMSLMDFCFSEMGKKFLFCQPFLLKK